MEENELNWKTEIGEACTGQAVSSSSKLHNEKGLVQPVPPKILSSVSEAKILYVPPL